MNWSPQQSAIFQWFAAPPSPNLVVRARAGTGKTTTIVEAVRHVPGDPTMLVAAFNKRIADELKVKLRGTPGLAKTLHALGLMFLREAWGDVEPNDDVENDRLLAALAEVDGDATTVPWNVRTALRKLLSIAKGAAPFADRGELVDLAIEHDCEVDADLYGAEWMADVVAHAMVLSTAADDRHRISFDDMLYLPLALRLTRPIYDWVIVDEAQDMNASQLLLAQAARKPHGHIVVVGDDRQAIYGFRGADSTAIDRLKHELSAEELPLTVTYRCPQAVVREAARIVPDYTAAPDAPAGEIIRMTIGRVLDVAAAGDVILSRMNAPLVPLCLAFVRRNVPARIEGRDVGKMLADRVRNLRARNVPDFYARLTKWTAKATSRVLAHGKFVKQRLADIRDIEATLAALAEDARSVDDIVRRCGELFGDSRASGNLVVLSSVHKAKGLEWDRVFLLEGTLYCGGRRREEIEEANIHYVAVTRAKRTLVLVGDGEEHETAAAGAMA